MIEYTRLKTRQQRKELGTKSYHDNQKMKMLGSTSFFCVLHTYRVMFSEIKEPICLSLHNFEGTRIETKDWKLIPMHVLGGLDIYCV